MKQKLMNRLIEEEGLCLKPYRCSANRLTIGVGRNLEDKGLSKEEAFFLLENDIDEAISSLTKTFDFFKTLDETRQIVLLDMCFNMGLKKLKGFKKMIKAIENKDFSLASKEMLSSCWAYQVKNRATCLAHLMKEGTKIK